MLTCECWAFFAFTPCIINLSGIPLLLMVPLIQRDSKNRKILCKIANFIFLSRISLLHKKTKEESWAPVCILNRGWFTSLGFWGCCNVECWWFLAYSKIPYTIDSCINFCNFQHCLKCRIDDMVTNRTPKCIIYKLFLCGFEWVTWS